MDMKENNPEAVESRAAPFIAFQIINLEDNGIVTQNTCCHCPLNLPVLNTPSGDSQIINRAVIEKFT